MKTHLHTSPIVVKMMLMKKKTQTFELIKSELKVTECYVK